MTTINKITMLDKTIQPGRPRKPTEPCQQSFFTDHSMLGHSEMMIYHETMGGYGNLNLNILNLTINIFQVLNITPQIMIYQNLNLTNLVLDCSTLTYLLNYKYGK